MFAIRKIDDDTTPGNKEALEHVQHILSTQFPLLDAEDVAKLPEQLRNPLKYRLRALLFVAENLKGQVKGFALLFHAPDLNFCYLDFLSAAAGRTGGGVGGALYQRIREEAKLLGAEGIFFECLPDDPMLSPDTEVRTQNAIRLKFYERYGARPIINTAYETPLKPGDDNPPYLVFDDADTGKLPSRERARAIVRAILERKYGELCPKEYRNMVVNSFADDPIRLREFRYVPLKVKRRATHCILPRGKEIVMVINHRHSIHHVRDRGYVEAPVRIDAILRELTPTGLFHVVPQQRFGIEYIKAVHDPALVDYLKKACALAPVGKPVYPYVFPIRNAARPPKELPLRAGYYCIDTFTPIHAAAFPAAQGAVNCALTAAQAVRTGTKIAYALVRPPGHHAERRSFGGFCYFNSAAVAAHWLSKRGKVAVLDVDYHHGNGTQDIFYKRNDVLTISIHGHPRTTYPYFSGFDDETGEEEGRGFNVNYPLPENLTPLQYREILEKALKRIQRFKPMFLVIALGLDTAKGDPTGAWALAAKDFFENGKMIGSMKLPTVVVQEGGYRTQNLGINARHFFQGLWEGCFDVKIQNGSTSQTLSSSK